MTLLLLKKKNHEVQVCRRLGWNTVQICFLRYVILLSKDQRKWATGEKQKPFSTAPFCSLTG